MRSIRFIISKSLPVSQIGLAIRSSSTGAVELVKLDDQTMRRYEKCYSTDNGVLAFIFEGVYYLMKGYGHEDDLLALGFTERHFPVCLSSGDFPAGKMTRWQWDQLPKT